MRIEVTFYQNAMFPHVIVYSFNNYNSRSFGVRGSREDVVASIVLNSDFEKQGLLVMGDKMTSLSSLSEQKYENILIISCNVFADILCSDNSFIHNETSPLFINNTNEVNYQSYVRVEYNEMMISRHMLFQLFCVAIHWVAYQCRDAN